MVIDKAQVRRILVITLSNIGDIILTTPVIRTLKNEFPGARVDVMVGPQGKEIFEKDPAVFKLIIYDKHLPISEKRRLQLKLKKLKYDLVVDLRNTVFPLLIGPKYRTATIEHFPRSVVHRRDRHLYRLKAIGITRFDIRSYVHIPEKDEEHVSGLLKELNVTGDFVVVNPSAKSHLKRWTAQGFAEVSDRIMDECSAGVLLVGTGEDKAVVRDVIKLMKNKPHDLTGKTNIRQLAGLLKRSRLLITNDSAPMHLACAMGVKVLAIFGPTDPKKYGPTGEFDMVINEKLSCSPCEQAVCAHDYECMKLISAEAVFDSARMMIDGYE